MKHTGPSTTAAEPFCERVLGQSKIFRRARRARSHKSQNNNDDDGFSRL